MPPRRHNWTSRGQPLAGSCKSSIPLLAFTFFLRSKEDEHLVRRIDAKDAGTRSGGDALQNSRDLDKGFAALVKAEDVIRCIHEPDAIPAGRNLSGIPPYAVHRAFGGIIAKNII